ncbi:LysR family transcriptional regulator [Bordetella hinzii]|uniref:LysR family transcriptional regulator n=2 Tax=Bordetella hinzii TaxID=103855 RepID=A0AAN1RWS5_9BORD|nr:LysR family transcriptional regulator [Bordetella hinzii]AKQ61531.1 HTH-type transcriptional regulator CatM [Bordetella hinzii]AZW17506.1 LysR family transcriptional regulator [Bordetella hinzii]KCB23942.1 LysR substrate-binding domain protein [Bordetella hinzii OH87 BAL007II]KCB33292.1 LysR substrate-binding domain protein [Bordetella hinzii CA90 BAL1384]KCB42381.1 LysR substrate-binding domain protein [Bordetella hinzii 5132]
MLIDLVQLRTFVAVADEQHLTRAAERLHISQSAASAHVRAVEDTLGTQLFARTNRNLELTEAGKLLLARAKTLLNEATLFTSFARELNGKVEGKLIVGSTSEPVSSRIGAMIARLRGTHPLIHVDLRARPSSSSREGLHGGELDLGLFLDRPTDPDFTYYQLATIPFRVAGPIAWKAQIEAADWAGLARLPWIAPNENSIAYATMLRQLFDERGLTLNAVAWFDNATLGRAMLEAGVGMMLMREERVRQGVAQGLLAVSPLVETAFPLFLAHLASRRNDPLVDAFLGAAAETWPDMRRTRQESVTAPA